jgi:hypothetical protein
MFGLFKPKPTWRERHKVQDQYSQIAISHGWSIDNFDGHPKDPWYREINLIKSIHVYDWEPSIKREDDGYITDVEFTMRICIWDVYLNAFYIGPPASHTFKDDSFTGGTLKMYEEIWMDGAVEAYKAKMSEH